MKNSYKGFDLFNDVEPELQRRNRAVILTNILEDNWEKGKVSVKGGALLLGYFNEIPEEQRKQLLDEFIFQAANRGYKISNNPQEVN